VAAFYADENVPDGLADRLCHLGHDVLTARDDGRSNRRIPDPDVLARAIALGRTVLTGNRNDYHKLHVAVPAHAGIVTYSQDDDLDALAGRVHQAVSMVASMAGVLVRVVRPSV
jgi:predicted nuclease of predicted toxin-antitoxin system